MKMPPSLHKALLAGESRAPLSPDPTANPALQALLSALPESARLWQSIAATDLWQRAGYLPAHIGMTIAPAAADQAACSRAAAQVLQLILRGIHPELLGNWLALAQAKQCRLPHEALVRLIELGMQKPPLRPAIADLLGQRGAWLVAQHPEWAEAFAPSSAEPADDSDWALGTLAQRKAILLARRRSDPAAALAMLEADWQQEPLENRLALLPCLATGISLADEAFLERALDDKRKEVRTLAQQLLSGLAGSQLGERCKSCLLALFTLVETAGGKKLAVRLPEACDPAMKRDGIGAQTHQGMGEKAGWLLDLMCRVSPLAWSAAWQMTPLAIVELFAVQEFKLALLTGLVRATGRLVGSDSSPAVIDWFVSLFDHPRLSSPPIHAAHTLLPDLQALPPREQEAIVLRWLNDPARHPHAFSHAISWASQRADSDGLALSPELSRILLGLAQRATLARPQHDYASRNMFTVLGRALDVSDPGYAMAGWPADDWEHWPQWREPVDGLMETLKFRHTMQASFLENDA